MAFACTRRGAVAGVQVGLVDHDKSCRLKRPQQLLADGRFGGHGKAFMAAMWDRGHMADVQRSRRTRNVDLVRAPACAHTRKAMKLDSKYFDSVRVKPDHEKAVSQEAPVCQWKGCSAAGLHRAPRGRGHEGEYYLLCLEHVRQRSEERRVGKEYRSRWERYHDDRELNRMHVD